jgi:hypothetical protein
VRPPMRSHPSGREDDDLLFSGGAVAQVHVGQGSSVQSNRLEVRWFESSLFDAGNHAAKHGCTRGKAEFQRIDTVDAAFKVMPVQACPTE